MIKEFLYSITDLLMSKILTGGSNKTVTNFQSISWSQFEVDVKALANKIGKKHKYILAVSKGGLIPAYYLAKILGIEVIKTVCVSSYKTSKRKELVEHKIEGFDEKIEKPQDWVIVEDFVDSGTTQKFLRDKFKGVKIASVVTSGNAMKPDYFGRELNNSMYIRFPWERN